MVARLTNRVGKSYPLICDTELTEKLSSDGSLSFTIDETEKTKEYIDQIGPMWEVNNLKGANDYIKYVVILIERNISGGDKTVNINCREKHIHDLLRRRIYNNVSGSFTAQKYFEIVFNGSGYKFILRDKVSSKRWENAGEGDSRLDMLKNGLDRYGLEYEYDAKTKTFNLYTFIKNKQSYFLSSDINLTEATVEEDASSIYTQIRGYGDFEENTKFEEAGLQLTFDHPMSKAIGIHEAPPFIDGRFKNENALKSEIESIVAKSRKISLTVDFLLLKEKYPEAKPKPGDVVKAKISKLNINEFVRIIEVKTIRNAKGVITDQSIVLGDYQNRERYIKATQKAAKFTENLTKQIESGGLGSGPAKTILNMNNKINAVSYMTRDLVAMAQVLKVDGEGISSGDDNNRIYFNADGSIEKTNDGGETKQTILDSKGINEEELPKVTESQNGLMLKEDKVKLDKVDISNQLTPDDKMEINKMPVIETELNKTKDSLSKLITDTGWIDYAVIGIEKNTNFTTDGFKCGYKVMTIGKNKICSIRVNLKNIKHNVVVANLPEGIATNAQTFPCRTSSNKNIISGELRKDGRLLFNIHSADQSVTDLWVYQEHTWIE
ncbi:phage tail protein [Mammaliicoccus sciuri]|uniref:phage tail protein n=1 Tax=Mammaliicoccus sciuri TaxID=1296 RepID=UPI0037A19E13